MNKDGAPGPDGFRAIFFSNLLGYSQSRGYKCSHGIFHQ